MFRLRRGRRITIGRLGRFGFPAGVYLYVGSAQRNLRARLRRHGRRAKPLRWHIDYLTAHARMLSYAVVPGSKDGECQLAAELASLYERPVPRFGASDCRCPGHLFYARKCPENLPLPAGSVLHIP